MTILQRPVLGHPAIACHCEEQPGRVATRQSPVSIPQGRDNGRLLRCAGHDGHLLVFAFYSMQGRGLSPPVFIFSSTAGGGKSRPYEEQNPRRLIARYMEYELLNEGLFLLIILKKSCSQRAHKYNWHYLRVHMATYRD